MSMAPEPVGVVRGQARRDLVAGEILDQAAVLFAHRGFQATTLQDLADVMGVSRPAIYHYFSSKEDVLAQLVRGITRGIADRLEDIRKLDCDPSEKLRMAVEEVAGRAASNPARFIVLDRSEGDLPAGLSQEHRAARRDVVEHWSAIINEGVALGRFRSVDARIATYALLGMSTWVAWWFRPEMALSAQEVARAIADMALASIEHHRREPAADALGALVELRGQLDFLEQLLNSPNTIQTAVVKPSPSERGTEEGR